MGQRVPNASTQTALYLVVDATAATAGDLSGLIANSPVAALLIRSPAFESANANAVSALITTAHAKGIPALLEAPPQKIRSLGADGMHLAATADLLERYRAARAELGENAMIGIDAGKSRHMAMELGDAGADYIGFGAPFHLRDRARALARRLDLITWWAEIFEPPCVAFDVTELSEATALAAAGADFIALEWPERMAPTEYQDHLRNLHQALTEPHPSLQGP